MSQSVVLAAVRRLPERVGRCGRRKEIMQNSGRSRIRGTAILPGLVAALVLAAAPVQAQEGDGGGRWYGASVGWVHYGAGKTAELTGCASHPAVALGVEVRTRDEWYLSAGADVLMNMDDPCLAFIPYTRYQGEWVEIWSALEFTPGLRLTARAGRVLDLGRYRLIPALSGGVLLGEHSFWRREPYLWQPWFGVSVELRRTGFPLGVRVELARHPVHSHYVPYPERVGTVYEWSEWESYLQVALVF